MNPDEYTNMARMETRHWFYVGKRQIARWALRKFTPKVTGVSLMDCGAWPGQFAAEVQQEASYAVKVMDDHEESLAMLRARFKAEQVVTGSTTSIPLADESEDCVTLLDVLEHVEDDAAAVAELYRVLKPGGGGVKRLVHRFLYNSMKDFSGRLLSSHSALAIWPLVTVLKAMPLGKYSRIRPLIFATAPRCQGLCGLQK
ncbi:MAG: class I SAM-dependent methyltransferase [Candidatus Synoicihabitans palmerolidicus]|nr:class I SAM-dependent methyltransferase [Candidatus Synoicihabitans palmerolidicus]